MGGAGLEQTALALSETPIVAQGGTESGTRKDENTHDPALTKLIEAWPHLAPEVRAAIVNLIEKGERP